MASLIAKSLVTSALAPRGQYQDIHDWREHCTLQTCKLSDSYWDYLPSIPANALFLAVFSLSTVLYIGQGILSRRFIGFTIAMACGCALEIIGYVGRVQSHSNPFKENPFLTQIICLTIAPAFMAAGIYLCLSRIVTTFGPENSRLAAKSYPRIFIPCDIASLMLQAAGGGISSAASHSNKDPTTGNNIMIAGLAVQVFTLAVFMILAADFSWRTFKRTRELGTQNALDPRHAKLRSSKKFKGFLIALTFATLCIFTRSVYRVAELSEGWEGHLIKTQRYFIGLEGAIVGLAVLALNIFHPGLCFREGYETGNRGCCGCFGRSKRSKGSESATPTESYVAEPK